MYFRCKRSGGHEYLQVVESQRVEGKPRQTVVATLGRLDALRETGALDRLLRSGARLTDSAVLLSAFETGETTTIAARRIGPALVFERLWRETGCQAAITAQLADRAFGFPVERAIFLTVLHRLMDPGSDRAAEHWRDAYAIDGMADLDLHHLYRAMAWLGEELDDQTGKGLVPRTTKDLVEEGLFARRRTLFSAMTLAIFDTTSLYFEGRGGETLGRFGHSKDHRPDLHQMVLGVVIDGEGRPIMTEMWPGNTADVTTLLAVVDRLRQRFHIARTCVIADRGMISAKTIAELEQRGIDYILGVRERRTVEATAVLADDTPYVPLTIPKARGRGTLDLQVKEVSRTGPRGGGEKRRRYIVCFNEAEARNDAAARQAMLAGLADALAKGDKKLIGNKGFRRFIKTEGGSRFAIDADKAAAEAKFDGLYILRTNTAVSALEVAIRYRQRYRVEDIFRTSKSLLETRPIFHKRDETIRGHVFCSFLALVLQKELMDRLTAAGDTLEWADVIRDLDRLVETVVEQDGKCFRIRPPAPGCAGKVFAAAGVALPPLIQAVLEKPPPEPAAPSPSRTTRRKPRRSAKPSAEPGNALI